LSPRLAFRFILLSLILAAILMGIAVVLNGRLRVLQQAAEAPPPIEAQLASMAMKLDANGIGSQVISGTQISVRLAPYPAQAGQASQLSVVATSLSGQLAVITPTLYLSGDTTNLSEETTIAMARDSGGAYIANAMLFPKPGAWQARIAFYLNATETSHVILRVKAQ
jgi:hypothetical protein